MELFFEHALRMLVTHACHFGMNIVMPISCCSGDQYLHHKSKEYRAVKREISAYYHNI